VLLSVVLVSLMSGLGFFVYQVRRQPDQFPLIASGVQRVADWVAARKTHMSEKLEKVGRMAANKEANNAEQQVHFEFYTALPNMQIVAMESETSEASVPKKVSPIVPSVAKKVSPIVVSANDLERELSEQLSKQKSPVIRMGKRRAEKKVAMKDKKYDS